MIHLKSFYILQGKYPTDYKASQDDPLEVQAWIPVAPPIPKQEILKHL